jgi:hypothetical protein
MFDSKSDKIREQALTNENCREHTPRHAIAQF